MITQGFYLILSKPLILRVASELLSNLLLHFLFLSPRRRVFFAYFKDLRLKLT